MDPMDYTMDDGQPNHSPNTAPRCQYQQPHQPGPNAFNSQARNGHHYDPVHNNDAWYPTHNPNFQGRPSYAHPQMSQWGSGPYLPIHGWQGFGEGHAGVPSEDGPSYRAHSGYMAMANMPWAQLRDHEQSIPLGHPPVTYPLGTPVEQTTSRASAQLSTTSAAASQTHSSFSQLHADLQRRADRLTSVVSNQPPDLQGRSDDSSVEPALRNELTMENRAAEMRQDAHALSRASRYNFMRTYASQEPPHGRRRNGHWDSDDDDDLVPDLEIEAIRRSSDLMFGAEGMDEERSMAAMRAQIAAAKKVPSKEAIASMEKVNPKELKDADRSCIICYNEFGVANPEGIVESPVRLPKCKHVFGNKCIKKWFEDSDSCPYCRDKLPSELSIRKSVALESLRAYRAGMGRPGESHRARHGFSPRYPSSEDFAGGSNPSILRSQEEYHYIMGRHPEHWGYPPPNRSSPADSPENRRRQARGRVGSNRATHLLGRPTSLGSARFIIPPANSQTASQRGFVLGMSPPNSHHAGNPPRRSITPGLARQSSNPGYSSTTPPRSRLSSSLSSSSEEASPPVAVGSGVASGERSTTPTAMQQRQASSLDYSINEFADPFGAFLNPGEANYNPLRRPTSSRTQSNDISGSGRPFETPATVTSSTHQHASPEMGNNSQSSVRGLDIAAPAPSSRSVDYSPPMSVNPWPRWSR